MKSINSLVFAGLVCSCSTPNAAPPSPGAVAAEASPEAAAGAASPASAAADRVTPPPEIIVTSDVRWEPLNPARGERSPTAGTLWGDRDGEAPTGFLVKFEDGFASPPHIHNTTYRSVVIRGLIHNDDPDAAKMWMPSGSFWTQPQGEVHITAAQGPTNIALVEIDRGPYLVRPPEEAVDNGERPVNVDASNLVWVSAPGWTGEVAGPRIAYLWGRPDDAAASGIFVKLPAGFVGELRTPDAIFRAVVIQGEPRYLGAETTTLEPGSALTSRGRSVHPLASPTGESILYVNTAGRTIIEPASR